MIFVISDVVTKELEKAPTQVRDLFSTLSFGNIELLIETKEVLRLRDAY